MDAGQPRRDLLPLCDGPGESDVAVELQQQENAIMKELADAKQATERFSERAVEEAEKRDVLSKELSEAIQHKWMTEGTIYATLQKSKMEVHHCEHEAVMQRQVGAKAEQAGRDLARSLSESQSEADAYNESQIQQAAEAKLNRPKTEQTIQSKYRCHHQLSLPSWEYPSSRAIVQYPNERATPMMPLYGGLWSWETSRLQSRNG